MGILLECHKVTYKSGEIIYDEGHKSKHIYFIVNGEVEISKMVGDTHLVLSSYGEF
jgi:CRP-like cAMP-binding protein